MEQKYCAFISYRHVSPDSDIAKALHTAIETYGIPGSIKKQTGRKKMGKVFRDQEELPLSADLGADIEAALEASDWLICVCSPRYLQSLWCLREVEYFLEHKGRDHILAVLAEGEPEESFPDCLCRDTAEDGTEVAVEPLAADLRGADPGERRKKLRSEVLRLLAPMLGVNYDDLKRRARQRRIRQAAAACAAALVLAGGISAYAASNHAKNERLRLEAEEQQRIAAEQQQLAEERKRQAEEEAKRAEEEKARAEEEAKRAEEEKARAEEERIRAVSNSIGELLERASSDLAAEDRRFAAEELLDALELSEAEGDLRREEILSLLRRDMYISPFASVSSFTGQNLRLNDVLPAPSGNLALGFEGNGTEAALIDLDANEVRYRVHTGDAMAVGLCFSPQGDRFLAICDQGRLVTVWNTADGSEAFRYVSRANHEYHIANACFLGDGDTLLVQDMDRFLLVSADGTEKLIYTFGQYQESYDPELNYYTLIFEHTPSEIITSVNTEDYTGTGMCVSADGSRILVSGLDGSTGTLILDGQGRCVTPIWGMPATFLEKYSLSPDGKLAACVSYLGFLAWWDTETGDLIQIDGYDSSGGASFSGVVFSPAGDRLAAAVNGELRVYDAHTGELLISGSFETTSIVPDVKFSADGNWLFLTCWSLYIIDARSGALYEAVEGDDSSYINNAAEVGSWLFVSRSNGSTELRCMPVISGVEHQDRYAGTLCPEYDPARAPAGASLNLNGEHRLSETFKTSTYLTDLNPKLFFDREGTRAALYYPDGVIELFDLQGDGSVSATISQLTQEVCAFGMTERWLAACAYGGHFMLYDLEEARVIRSLQFQDFFYFRLAFSADGKLIMAQRSSGGIDVYEISAARLLFTLRSTEAFTDFGFAADGSAAVGLTASGAEVASLWTDEEALIARAKRIAGRS